MSNAIVIILTSILIDFLLSSQHYNMPKFYLNATWNRTGTSFPSLQHNLKCPLSIFVDINGSVYVSFDKVGIVIVWYDGFEEPSKIYYQDKSDSSISSFLTNIVDLFSEWFGSSACSSYISNSLFVTSNGDIYVGNSDNYRIDIWSPDSSKSHIELDYYYGTCYGLFVDTNNTLYCSVKLKDKVLMKSFKNVDTQWKVRAENKYTRYGSVIQDNLNRPHGIFVDVNFNLYVADCGGNRIQLFNFGEKNGKTVVSEELTIDERPLRCPTNVILDGNKNLYIVDSNNNRIIFVTSNFDKRNCLIGCSTKSGSSLDSLNAPIGISFDSCGNILVSDTKNNRVLKFLLERGLYAETTTTPEKTTRKPTTTISATTPINSVPTAESTTSTISSSTSTTSSTDSLALSGSGTTSSTTDKTHTTNTSTSSVSPISTKTQSTTTDHKTTPTTIVPIDDVSPPAAFVPRNCSNSSYIGSACDTPMTPCDAQQPCKNSGNCTNDPKRPFGYYCTCEPDFTGADCGTEIGPCKANTCLYNGICIPLNNTHFQCNCTKERTGTHCEDPINYCKNVTCLNNGICRSLPSGYKCECLTVEYSGRHCENVARSIIVRQYVSKTFGYIAIIALFVVFAFVVIMDILKYVFGIDPVHEERELLRRRRAGLGRQNLETSKPRNTLHWRRTNKISPK